MGGGGSFSVIGRSLEGQCGLGQWGQKVSFGAGDGAQPSWRARDPRSEEAGKTLLSLTLLSTEPVSVRLVDRQRSWWFFSLQEPQINTGSEVVGG